MAAPAANSSKWPPSARIAFLALEASVSSGGRILAQRHLLRLEAGDRRFELRPPGTIGSVSVDVAPGLMHATLVGEERTTLELEWMVPGEPAALDAWAIASGPESELTILDGLGRPVIGDLAARDPAMPPMIAAPGIYLLRAEVRSGPAVIRIGESIAARAIRAAV